MPRRVKLGGAQDTLPALDKGHYRRRIVSNIPMEVVTFLVCPELRHSQDTYHTGYRVSADNKGSAIIILVPPAFRRQMDAANLTEVLHLVLMVDIHVHDDFPVRV